MDRTRNIHVACPACHVVYRLWDATLLPIARCGRCYGTVVAEDAIEEAAPAIIVSHGTAAA